LLIITSLFIRLVLILSPQSPDCIMLPDVGFFADGALPLRWRVLIAFVI